jgi:hypothetical protein
MSKDYRRVSRIKFLTIGATAVTIVTTDVPHPFSVRGNARVGLWALVFEILNYMGHGTARKNDC